MPASAVAAQYTHNHHSNDKPSTIFTSPFVADALHTILTSTNRDFPIVLDPCIGQGDMVWPFNNDSEIIGCDITRRPAIANSFKKADFTSLKRWGVQPDLIMCNPPFNGGDRRMMWPERFMRHIIELFGPSVPTALIVPVGFRFNQRWHSKRRRWLKFECPRITTIVTLPIDAFDGVDVCSEILIFNLPELECHYII